MTIEKRGQVLNLDVRNKNVNKQDLTPGRFLGDYVYNAKGQRVKKAVNEQTTIFHFDQGGLMIAESASAGTITAEYAYLNGQPLAKIENNSVNYYHNDHLGTPVLMTDSSSNTVWQGESKPFGEPVSVTGSITNNLRFPGQYYDSETGLHQNWHRDYMVDMGRYLEADPILQPMIDYKIANAGCSKIGSKPIWRVPGLIYNPQDLYPYIYAKKNPENFVDPTGLICGTKWVDWIVPDNYGKYNFIRPCTNHDKCYGCEGKKANKSKADCDRDFLRDMKKECKKLSGYWYYDCMLASHVYYGFVVTLGGDAYVNGRKEKCCK